MILKLGMLHQGCEVYTVYVNDDPELTLTCFTDRSNLLAYAFEWEKLLQSYLKGKNLKQMTELTDDLCF